MAFSAGAGSFTWIGGASGNWNASANWSPAGVPTGGDSVDFVNTVDILDDVAIGAGTLSITNSSMDCKAIHFRGVISGPGAIDKRGAAALHLHSANTFAGGLQADGTGYTTEGGYIYSDQVSDAKTSKVYGWSGEVVIYNGEALGPHEANIGMGSWNACRLRCVGDMTITNNVKICQDRDNNQTGSLYMEGNVQFLGSLTGNSRTRFLGTSGVTWEVNRFAIPSWFNGTLSGTGAKFIYHGPWASTSKCTFAFGAPLIELHAPLYATDCRTSAACVKWFCDEALSNAVNSLRGSANTVYDLNGHRQTFGAITTFEHPNSVNYGFRNSAATPAALTFRGTGVNMHFRGVMDGDIDFTWAVANKEFVFSNNVKRLTGSVTVSNGTVVVSRDAALRGLREISVCNAGAFRMESGAGVCFAAAVTLEAGRKLDLAAGTVLTTRALKVGDVEYPKGTYTLAGGASFIEGAGTVMVGVNNEWQGGSTGRWDDPANWSLNAVPAEGDNVVIDTASTVTLDATTPRLGTVVIGGGDSTSSLMLTNWTTALVADSVTVASHGRITSFGPYGTDPTNEPPASRVWVQCRDFTVAVGGDVNVNGLGWRSGWGLGAGYGSSYGAAHMGLGGWYIYSGYAHGAYDNPYQPELPGSGGRYDSVNVAGGGVVRIEATGTVRVDGTVTACGGNTAQLYNMVNGDDTAGSGGSVWISCATFAGAGEVLAEGGKGGNPRAPANYVQNGTSTGGRPGGGGGVRIDYDALGSTTGMKISAAEGVYTSSRDNLTFANQDLYRTDAEPGTLCFSDQRLFDALVGKGLNGKIVGISNYVRSGDLDFGYGHVRFAETGVAVRVEGDLTVTGAWSRLDLGGFSKRIWATRPYVDAGDRPVSLTVTGDFTLSHAAGFGVYAAATNANDQWGATVTVGGAFNVLSGARVLPTCDFVNTGAPHFEVGSFQLSADSVVDADHRGGSGGWDSGDYMERYGGKYDVRMSGCGVGAGNYYGSAGHGGAGAVCYGPRGNDAFTAVCTYANSSYAGLVCDNPYRPTLPGAGGGSGGYSCGGDGGGIFHLVASGAVEVDGTITANGASAWYCCVGYMDCFGSGAGGTIFLSGATFRGGATALLSARGGDSWRLSNELTPTANDKGGVRMGATGGGGCVAVWTGLPWEEGLSPTSARVLRSSAGSPAKAADAQTFAGHCDVTGGTNLFYSTVYETDPKTFGSAGTTWFCHLGPEKGTFLIFR